MAIKKQGPMIKKQGNHAIVDGIVIGGYVIKDGKMTMVRGFYTWDAAMNWLASFQKSRK